MTAIVLMAYLAAQEWSWDAVAGATKYRLYWHADPACYESFDYVEVDAASICNETVCDPGRCCYEPGEPAGSAFLTITAVNLSGLETVDERRQEVCP